MADSSSRLLKKSVVLFVRGVLVLVFAVVSQSFVRSSAQAEGASLALGQPCASNGQCKSGACDLGGYQPSKTCVPANNTGLAGQYCRDDAQCKGNRVCDFRSDSSKCGDPYGELGEGCFIYGRLPIAGLNTTHIQENKTHCKSTSNAPQRTCRRSGTSAARTRAASRGSATRRTRAGVSPPPDRRP